MVTKSEYDVVVIGSGMGGLGAGALLSRWGYRTLVVESLNRLGGRCSHEEIEGFKCSTGAIALYRGGVIDEIYQDVGAKLDLINVTRLWYRIEGKDYEMQKGTVAGFLDIISKLEVQRARLFGHIAKEVATEKVMNFFRRGVRGEEKAEGITFQDWLLQYTDNELALKTFDAFCCNVTGWHIYEIPATEMFRLFSKRGRIQLGIAPKGNEVNAMSLAKVVKANGDVWTNCPAKQIIVRDGVARGIVVQKGGDEIEITSSVVISNVGPRTTVKLAGRGSFDEQYLAQVAEMRPLAIVLIHVGSDIPLCLEGGEPGSIVIVGARRMFGVFPSTNISPELAPPGQHLYYCLGTPEHPMEPVDEREEIEQNMLDIKEHFPKFESHGRVLKAELIFLESPRPGTCVSRETPVENLYNVGDDVKSPGSFGVSAAMESAKDVAAKVRKSIKPPR